MSIKSFYGLTDIPFQKEVPTSEMFKYPGLDELIERLDYMKRHRGMMLLTSLPGCGKSTAMRCFIESLNANSFLPVYLPLSTVSKKDFYKQLNVCLCGENKSSKSELFKSIQSQIMQFNREGRTPVIIFDEAHLFLSDNFFELQIITNFKCDSYDPAVFILSAQPHIIDRLSAAYFSSFMQRIGLKYSIKPLGKSETKEYILHGLKVKGRKEEIFTEGGQGALFNISGGIMRVAGNLALKTLILGAEQKKQVLTEEEVMLASREL